MRLVLPVIFSLLFISFASSAQYHPYWQWAQADTTNAAPTNASRQAVAARNGKSFWGHLLQQKLVLNGTAMGDYLLEERDTSGVILTNAAIHGKVALLQAKVDGAGNWYILGRFSDSLLFTNTQPIFRGGNEPDYFMARLNSGSLSLGWLKRLGNFNDVSAQCFTIMNSTNTIYLPEDSTNSTQVYMLDANTGVASRLFSQGRRSTTSSIAVDASGGIMMAGSCGTGGIDFNGTLQSPVSGNNFPAYLVRYTSTGVHRWHYWLPEQSCVSRSVNVAPGGIIYYTGALQSGFTFGTQAVHPPVWSYDFIAARLDTSGNVAWVRQIDTAGGGSATAELPYTATVTPDSSLALFLTSTGFVDWRDNVSTSANQYNYATVVSFGKDGHTRWAFNVKGDLSTDGAIASDGSDALFMTGNGYSSLNYLLFDTTHLYVRPLAYNPYLAKLRLTARPTVPVGNGVAFVGADMGVRVYPNPSAGVLYVSFTALPDASVISLRDVTGKVLRQEAVSKRQTVLDVRDLAKGLYLLDIRSPSASHVEKIVLQ